MTCQWYDICPLRKLEKEGKIDNGWRKVYCETENNWQNCQRYQMEENGEPHPDNLMPDGTILEIEKNK